jgi:hypothetical protein
MKKQKKVKIDMWKSRTCQNCGKRCLTIDKLFDHIEKDHKVQEATSTNYGQAMGVDYRKMYEDLKDDQRFRRYDIINDWMKSVATINDAIAHAIGELGGGR